MCIYTTRVYIPYVYMYHMCICTTCLYVPYVYMYHISVLWVPSALDIKKFK